MSYKVIFCICEWYPSFGATVVNVFSCLNLLINWFAKKKRHLHFLNDHNLPSPPGVPGIVTFALPGDESERPIEPLPPPRLVLPRGRPRFVPRG